MALEESNGCSYPVLGLTHGIFKIISSSDASNFPSPLTPSNILTKPKGLERKLSCFFDLSFLLLLCHLAHWMVFNFLPESSLEGLTLLCPCLFKKVLISFLISLILFTLQLAGVGCS